MSHPSPSSRPGRRRSQRGRARRGFSLIEMLVVIGLIAFLSAAIVAVIPRVANASKTAATRATIKKVDEMLNDRINGFRRWIQKQDQIAGSGAPSYVGPGILAAVGNNIPVAKVIAVKQLFQQNFPQTYSELPQTIQNANPRGASHVAVTDSAECLYLILTKGALFDTEPPSASDLKAIETADTDNDGIPEIVDAWGQPLRFYRWPTRLVRAAAYSSSNTSGSLANPGPLDEVVQQPVTTPPPSVLIPPSPLTLAMVGAMPRPSLPVWLASHAYSLGDKVVSGNASSGYSVIYQCVVAGTSKTGASPFTGTQIVGSSVQDGTSTPALSWQVLIDPLSIDPDDPWGIATNYISETPSGSIPLPPITPNTWSVPLIISCGSDGQLGLYEPYDVANFGTLAQPELLQSGDPTYFNRGPMYDNISNHQQ
jgi:prepilin-type N-terminal cleavage/methylation domain-containing protein